jgi:hypothetical protein
MRACVALAVLAAASTAFADPFENRVTMIAGAALVYGKLDGELGSGFAVQPTIVRTFDRVELRADYLLGEWEDAHVAHAGALVQRASASAGYQLRKRVQELTMDAVLDGGIGVERVDFDRGGSFVRPDVSVGVDLRILDNLAEHADHRLWLGFEMMFHAVFAPSPRGVEPGFVFAFGVPIGR